VHYVPDGSIVHLAALVTSVADDAVTLTVFDADSMFRAYEISHDADCAPGTYHWPERD
jgi:hypothetical protein